MTNNIKKGINPLAAAAAGAVIGAGAVGVARVLGDKNKRKKIKDGLNSMKEKAGELIGRMKDTVEEKKAVVKDK